MSAHIYPLTSLQQGMLFHALSEPRGGADIEQLVITLRESVDAARMEAAWHRVVARHGILRTAFRFDGSEPLQEVHPVVDVPFSKIDATDDETAFSAWLQEDRRRGFAMDCAPLMRLTLFRHSAEHFRLVWTFHHGLLDGRSFPLVLDEVFAFYENPAAPEPPLPRPYRDFIEWRAQTAGAASEDYWKHVLGGFCAATPFPVLGLEGCLPTRTLGDADSHLDEDLTERLAAFAAGTGVTLNTLVQGAWAILLARYSGEDDVCFGATRACRRGTIDGAEDCVGLFINTVPVRTRVDAGMKIAEFLRGLRQLWVDMRPHEHASLARIQACSQLPPGQSLFKTLVVFENYDLATQFRARGGAWAAREIRLHEQTSFPICLAAYAGKKLRLVAEYDRSMLDEATVQRLLGHLTTILRALPEAHHLGEIPMLPAAERDALLRQNAAPADGLWSDRTLHALFSEQAAATPEAIALTQGNERLTYRELDERANAVAAHLAVLGVGTGEIVGLCMERRPALVVALLGILKAGAAYLPIDLAYPAERLAFMLEDAKAPVLLTERHLAAKLPGEHSARLVFFEDVPPAAAPPTSPGSPFDPCYVLYTSGSTGKPKGCCITHRNVVRLFTATEQWFHFTAGDVWTLFHSTAFDFSVWELWGALLYGGRLVVVPFETSRSPELFHQLLARESVTVLNQTPSAFRQLIAADAASPQADGLSLRTVVFGGEALEMNSLRPWFERHGDKKPQLVNMYGITETTVHVTYRPLTADDLTRGSVIGEPIPDLQIYVLDPQARPVPIGVPGELFVGGEGLAREYLGHPELTAQRFIENPFQTGTRLYRTGDLARWLPNRDIEYLGRIDQQVKIRGFRIELGEIESHLLTHPAIREAAVLARDSASGKRLIAWFVSNGASPAATELRTHLRAFVPDYMVPAAFVPVERMPLTNNGKLDHRALPEPPEERRDVAAPFVAPSSTAEISLAEIWQRLLRVGSIGIHDNFFELGGDSILSILVVTQARQRGLAVTPKLLFDYPTIAALAANLESSTARLADVPEAGEVPLTPVQRWFFSHQFQDAHHWNQTFAFRLKQPVTREHLTEAIRLVLPAHSAFRLRYSPEGRQFFSETPAAELADVRDAAAFQASLDLSGPLIRFGLADTSTLIIAAHHLIIDGVSWRILLADLDSALRGVALPPPTNGFQTWAAALLPATDGALAERGYWLDTTRTATPAIPRDHHSGENTEASASVHVLRFTQEETTGIIAKLPAGIRTQDVLLAGLADALFHWTGHREITIETEGHGREESTLQEMARLTATPDLSRTIGWFTTIYPLRLRSGESPGTTLATTARVLRSVPNHGFGYSLLRHLAPDGGQLQSFAEILFNYLGQFDHTVEGLEYFAFADTDAGPWHAPAAKRTHLLEINALILSGSLEVRFAFSRNLHTVSTIASLANNFAASVRAIVAEKYPLARIPVDEQQALASRQPSLEDLYPLSPMQRLFLAVETSRPGSGNDQWHCRLRGKLTPAALLEAWKAVAARHPALRSGYLADTAVPHQFVVREALPAIHFEDHSEQPARFTEFLQADAAKPFDLTAPPLTRFALFPLGESETRLVWTHHHLEIDGWSWPLVFKELSLALQHRLSQAPPVPPYRDFIGWLALLDMGKAEAFWRAQLTGFRQPTPLPFNRTPAPPNEHVAMLDSHSTDALNAAARRLKVTANAIVQCVWAALLAHHGGVDDVVFGAAFSGRPAGLPGVDRIIGHFVNNVPVRVALLGDTPLSVAAAELHTRLAAISEQQNAALADIQTWSELPWNARIFETLVVFQNYVSDGAAQTLGDMEMLEFHAPVQTNYPLTLIVTPGAACRFTIAATGDIASPDSLAALSAQWVSLLKSAVANPDKALRLLTGELPLLRTQPAVIEAKSSSIAPASSGLESQIAAIWAEAFGRAVSVHDNFFDIGGHSLLMIRVHARLVTALGRDIPVVKLFQYPSISALARFLGGDAQGQNISQVAKDRAAKARAAMARRPLVKKTL